MTVTAVIQVRMSSSRFRGKALMPLAGKPALVHVIERAQRMPFVDDVVVATSDSPADEAIRALVTARGIRVFAGSLTDVLGRFVRATADLAAGDCVVRLTADNPCYDAALSSAAYKAHVTARADYTHVDGLCHVIPEFVQAGVLREVAHRAVDGYDREHVTPFIRRHADDYRVLSLPPDFHGLRPRLDQLLTIDWPRDLHRIERLLHANVGDRLESMYEWLNDDRAETVASAQAPPCGEVTIAGRAIGDGHPTFIVAEIGQNHNGDVRIAERLIDMAARCGADAVKFQKRDVASDLTAEAYHAPYLGPQSFGATYGAHRERLELDEAAHRALREQATSLGLLYLCTACDAPSVEVMERIGNPAYKVASRDITNVPLLRYIADTRKPVILSTGMASIDDIDLALDTLGPGPAGVILLQCVSQYPAELEHVNLRAMHTLRDQYRMPVGLSDHTAGIVSSVAASVMGACVLEKHITLARAMKGTDHAGSLEEEGLRRLVRNVRDASAALGDGRKAFDAAAEPARAKLGRSLASRAEIARGTVITEAMLSLKSPGTGISWRDRRLVVGSVARRTIPPNRLIALDDVEPIQTPHLALPSLERALVQ